MSARWIRTALMLAAMLVAGCGSEAEPPLRIGTNVWIGSEPLYLARSLGHYEGTAVELAEYPSASEVLRAYRNGAIDGMVISMDELFGLAAHGLAPRVVVVADVSAGADVVVGRAGMQGMHDLQGRPVAVESAALGAFVLSRALALNDMTTADVEIVHLESNEQPDAFERGEVDAAVTFDPYRTQLLAAGATILFDSTRIPGEIVDVLTVRASVLDERPAAVQALVDGWFAALDHLRREPRDAAKRMGLRQQLSADQFLAALEGLHIPSHAENLDMLGGAAPALVASGAHLMQLMVEANLLDAAIDLEEVLAPGPLRGVPR